MSVHSLSEFDTLWPHRHAKKEIFDIQRVFPEISASIATTAAARTMLNTQRHAVYTLEEEGMLDERESERMLVLSFQRRTPTMHLSKIMWGLFRKTLAFETTNSRNLARKYMVKVRQFVGAQAWCSRSRSR